MKAYRTMRVVLLVLLSGGTLFQASCGDIIISSVKSGLLSFVSGSVTNTFSSTQVSAFLSNLFNPGSSMSGGGT